MKVVILFFLFLCNVCNANHDFFLAVYGGAYQAEKYVFSCSNKPMHPRTLVEREKIETLLNLPLDPYTRLQLTERLKTLHLSSKLPLLLGKPQNSPGPLCLDEHCYDSSSESSD